MKRLFLFCLRQYWPARSPLASIGERGSSACRGASFLLASGPIRAIGVKYMINDAIALRADVGIKQYSSSVTRTRKWSTIWAWD